MELCAVRHRSCGSERLDHRRTALRRIKINSYIIKIMAKVTIYSTPTCVYCKMAKEFFTKNNVAFEEHDVLGDLAARLKRLQRLDIEHKATARQESRDLVWLVS